MDERLTVIGTGHVFRIADDVRRAIRAIGPDVVFVELDRGRYHALRQRQQGVQQAPGKAAKAGFVQKKLQTFQESVAGMYGAEVGEEMLAAVDGARDVGALVAFVDPPAEDTLRRVLKALTWKEKLRAVGMLAKGTFQQAIPKKRKTKGDLEAEIKSYQEDPEAALAQVAAEFPTVYRIVIEERDIRMAEAIAHGMAGRRHGVAVVGDGHVPGLLKRLTKFAPEVFRLADVREGRLPKPGLHATGDAEGVHFGFTLPPQPSTDRLRPDP